jgi:endonuclease G
MAEDPTPSTLPNDEALAATEARLRNLLAPATGGFESMESTPAPEPPKSAKERARERLRDNPREAVARRLRRKGIAPTPLESGFESILSAEESFPESAQLSEVDIARGLERLIGRNELLGVQYLDGGQSSARSVGRIMVRRGPTRTVPMGTGFLVAPGLLMTNNHVLPTPQSARGGVVQFNYQCGVDGNMLTPAAFALDPDTFYLTSKSTELDFTLVAVRDTADTGARLADFSFHRLSATTDEVLAGESVTIIQHPGGDPKQIALRENFVLSLPGVADRYLYYQTDTTPGSSGSPVFNDDWEVVALHHSGYAKRNAENQILARDGRVWTENMGEDEVDWIANEGIRVAALLKFLNSVTGLDEGMQRILATALATATTTAPPAAAVPPPTPAANGPAAAPAGRFAPPSNPTPDSPSASGRESSATPSPPTRPKPAAPTPTPTPTGAVTTAETVVTIPLHISVRVGTPQAVAGLAPTPTATGALEKIEIDTDYSNREGYDAKFLGSGKSRVPLPEMTPAMIRDAVVSLEPADGAPNYELLYNHFSVVLSSRRRLAYFTAVNIDGTQEQKLDKREQDRWIFDHRVEGRFQIGNDWYAKPFDRGHLVRRLDPAWGRSSSLAKQANDDTFHFTNCSPQHARFNEGKRLWQGLENHLLDTANKEDRRISVFTGPIFADDDPVHQGVQVPKQFWKVAVWVRPDGTMGAAGFVISQEELLTAMGLEGAAEQVARTFQVRISAIEKLTELDFGHLRTIDTFRSGNSPLEAAEAGPTELESFDQIQL